MGLPVEVNNLMMGAVGGYQISRSLRFRSSASAYLNRTPASAGSQTTWTWSGWVKRGTLGTNGVIFGAYTNSQTYYVLQIQSTDQLQHYNQTASSITAYLNTTQVFRDPSAWYHIVAVYNSTNATASNRMALYVNGVQVTAFSTATYPSQNTVATVNSTSAHDICRFGGASNYFDGYLAEVNFIDGQALTPSSFGAYDTNGVWQPKKYSGTYGTNGFYLPFSDTTSTTTLVQDSSGNGNNWTPNNISLTAGTTYDSMIDSPTNGASSSNYAVLNPLDTGSSGSVSAGNLTHSSSGGGVTRSNASIRVPSSGKFYAEFINSSATNSNIGLGFGVSADSVALNAAYNAANSYHFYASNAAQAMNSGTTISISSWTNSANQTFQLSVDVDNSKVWVGQNNVWWDSSGGTTGNPSTGANPTFSISSSGFKIFTSIDTTSSVNWIANFGQRPFSYTPPSGFKALNTYNLPAPSIANGAQYMAATLYTGTGSNITITNSVNGIGFQPDFVWTKGRSAATNNILIDAVRGGANYLISDSTSAEVNNAAAAIQSFNSTGYVMGTGGAVNTNGATYVGWQWKGGGSAVTNNSGTISSQVSANTSAGISILTYSGNGTNGATVGHGLGVKPDMVIIKGKSGTFGDGQWIVQHKSLSGGVSATSTTCTLSSYTSVVFLNLTNAAQAYGFDAQVNGSSGTYVAYCFSAVSGFSAFGKWTGNGSSDGPFVFTNFRPRYVMWKRTDVSGDGWWIVDSSRNTYNVATQLLFAQSSTSETAITTPIDFLSNGFKLRNGADGSINGSGGTYIYMAFAENPFSIARAR